MPNYDNDSSLITLDDALLSITEEIKRNKEGIAWVYKNGTIGGGGGSGSGMPKFKVSVDTGAIVNDSIIVNNNQTVNLSFTITGTSTGRKMNISIRDNKGNYYGGYNNSAYTVTTKPTVVQISNITSDIIIEFTGYDQETLSVVESYTLSIKVSQLKIDGPESLEVSKSDTNKDITYSIMSTYGQSTYITLSTTLNINGKMQTFNYIEEPFMTGSKNVTYDIFSVFSSAGLNLEELLRSDSPIDNLEIIATAIAGDYQDAVTTSIMFTDENKVSIDIIPLNSISESGPSYEYVENDNISLTVRLYFSTNEFYMYYNLYQEIDGVKRILFEKGDLDMPTSNENKISATQFYSKINPLTIPYPLNVDPLHPVYMYVKAWDKNDQSFFGERTKFFKIKSDENWQPYNLSLAGDDVHIDGGLNYLYYEYNSNKFGEIEISDRIDSSRIYKGSGSPTHVNGHIKYFNANNITNGVILRGKNNELVNTLRMASKSYAVICDNTDKPFMLFSPNKNSNWLTNSEGWTFSISFKSDEQYTDNVVFSYATFDNLGALKEGIHITTTDVNVKLTNSTKQVGIWNLNAKLSQNVYNQVDIVYSPKKLTNSEKTINVGELRIYINGVLSAAGIEQNINFEATNYYPSVNAEMILGATHNGNSYVNYSDVNFYRILFYKRALTPYHITKNLIQGIAEVNVLSDGTIDRTANNELRNKNFFSSDGKCYIIDETTYTNTCSPVSNLYSILSTSDSNPLPIVLIKTTTDFRTVVDNRYTESEVAEDKQSSTPTITREYDCDITIIKEKSNKQFIMGENANAIGDISGKRCSVKLQGTSTLGNKSKNFEISFGAAKLEDNTNKENLVQVFDDMLPENSWILKADVMDSGHANNAAIGGFINDFLSTYSTTANTNEQNMYKSEIKATTAGHPVILFMQFGDNAPQEFLGIYSFNLGRISYYNLGYHVFDGYYKVKSSKNDVEKTVVYENHKIIDTTIEFPALVSSYNAFPIPYTSDLAGVDTNSTTAVCYECNGNNNIVGTFQQSGIDVINEFYYRVYPNIDNTNTTEAFDRFRKLFIATSNLYECDPENLCKMEEGDEYLKTRSALARNSRGEFFNLDTNEYEVFNANAYKNDRYKKQDSWEPADKFESLTLKQTNENDNHVGLNWEYASAYFTLAMLFGLTDSLGKNLNVRSFDLKDWYTSFYDMDTGLALTNAGYETVKNDVYLDKFSLADNKQESTVEINGYREGGYDTINSRLFNIVRFFTNKEYTTTGTKPTTNYRKIWEDIRKTLLKDPIDFINNYYIKQNKNVGEILFNYDYDVKYINDEINMISNPKQDIVGSINFLHGNRINYVRDWFTTHVFFLDGVFDIKCKAPLTNETRELYGNAAGTNYYGIRPEGNIESDGKFNADTDGVICPYISFSNQSDRVNPPFDGFKSFNIKSSVPMFFIYNNGTLNQRIFVDRNKLTEIKLYFKSGNEQTMTFNYAPYLTNFDKFGTLSYVAINKPNLKTLQELDLSDNKILSGAQDSFDLITLNELRRLNMNNVKTTSGNSLSVDLSNSPKIEFIDLRNSNVSSLTLPGSNTGNEGGSIEELYIDGTTIADINLINQSMLKRFSANNCKNLTSLIFRYNNLLEDVGIIPNYIKTLEFDECNSLKTLNLNNMKFLNNDNFKFGHLENLETFSYSHSSEKDANPMGILNLDFSGCPNLKNLILSDFKGEYITLNSKSKNTLESINISRSNIKYIIWNDVENNQLSVADINDNINGILDLRECKNINTVDVSGNNLIRFILLPDDVEINNINILQCNALERIIGRLNVNVNKFTNLSNFRFNEVCKYDNDDTTSDIILLDDGDVVLADDVIYEPIGDDGINDNYYHIKYDLKKLLTHYEFIEDGASVEGSFRGTGINVTDLYAILIKLSKWKSQKYISDENANGYITEFIETFDNCSNIKIAVNNSEYRIEHENIKLDIFANYKHLKQLISTFNNCNNINGLITDDSDNKNVSHDSIFTETLENISGVFNGCGALKINSYVFNKSNNLKHINKPFSANTKHYMNNYNDAVKPSIIFATLDKIEILENVFGDTLIMLQFANDNINLFFANNPNLKKIHKIIPNNFTAGSALWVKTIDLHDVFGGYSKYLKDNGKLTTEEENQFNSRKYPTKVEDLSEAFATTGNTNQPMLNWDKMNYIFYNLDVEFDSDSSTYKNKTLKDISYMFDMLSYVKNDDDDQYFDYTKDGNGMIAKFPIDMFNIKYKKDDIYHDVEFANLSNFSGLFKRSAFKDELKFPGNIFKYCTASKLNLSHLLEDTVMTPIKLVTINDIDENGNNYSCFSNCDLANVSAMFKNCFKGVLATEYLNENGAVNNLLYTSKLFKFDRGGLHGTIPYKFFYNKGKITNMESVFEGCCHMGTKIDLSCDDNGDYESGDGNFIIRDLSCFYNVRKPDITTIQNISNGIEKDYSKLLDLVEKDDSIYKWNSNSYDGTVFDDEYLSVLNTIILDGKTYLEAKHEAIPDYILLKINIQEDVECPIIEKVFDENNNLIKEIIPDKYSSITDLYDYLIISDNTKKSLDVPGCYIKHDKEIITINNDKFIKVYYDGDYDIKNVNYSVEYLSPEYQLWHCDSYTYIDRDLSDSYKHEFGIQAPTKFIRNYLCPMDIFNYCSSLCNINAAFKNISRFNNDDKRVKYNDYVYGLIGRIPPKIFDKLTDTISIQNVFENNKGIIPYAQSLDGQLYNNTFIKNNKLTDISGLFKNSMFIGHISDQIFEKIPALKNISETFKNVYMPKEYGYVGNNTPDYTNFVNMNTFIKNSAINNISGAFSRDDIQNDYLSKDAYLYFDLPGNLFSLDYNKNIINASMAFANQNNNGSGIHRTNNDLDTFIDFTKWPYIEKNYSNCYSKSNFNLEKIPAELGGNFKDDE